MSLAKHPRYLLNDQQNGREGTALGLSEVQGKLSRTNKLNSKYELNLECQLFR